MSLRPPILVWLLATALSAGLYWLGKVVPFVDRNLLALIAVVFLYLPVAIAWRRKQELRVFGFTHEPVKKNLLFGVGGPLIVFPLFFLAYWLFYDTVCATGAPDWMASLSPPGQCATFLGWERMHAPPLGSWSFAERAFTQLIVVALPEELFFRGYLLGELERALPAKRKLLGGGLGRALLLSSLLFALGHVLVDLDPRRLIVFFPGLLFGWMRSATGSILPGTVAHALANLYIWSLERTFFA